MRTAILITFRGEAVEMQHGKASEIRALYRRAKIEGIPGASSCELWESDRGRIRRRKFDAAGVPDATSAEESIDAQPVAAEPVKRGPGRPRKTITN